MLSLTISREYGALLAKIPPKVIRTEKENEVYTQILCDLDRRHKTLIPAEKELSDLLTLLIEDFEVKRYDLPRAIPLGAVRFLMEQHELRQKDLVNIFGTPSIVCRSIERPAPAHYNPHQTTERALQRLARDFFLASAGQLSR